MSADDEWHRLEAELAEIDFELSDISRRPSMQLRVLNPLLDRRLVVTGRLVELENA